MQRSVLVFPTLPGRHPREIADEMRSRPREYEESRRRLGVTLERVFLQHTPMGDYTVVYFETRGDITDSFAKVVASDLEIDRWFISAVKDVHGVDLRQPAEGSPPETAASWTDPGVHERRRGLAFCAPLRPGAADKGREFVSDAYSRPEFTDSRRKFGGSVEVATINFTPEGEVVAVYVEAKDPGEANRRFAESTDPFDLWFKDQLHGIFIDSVDFTRPVEGVVEVLDSTLIADLGLRAAA